DRTFGFPGAKPVPVPAVGLEPVHFDMDRMRPLRLGHGLASGDDAPHAFVRGHFPANGNGRGADGADEASPKDDAARPGVSGSDAEPERVSGRFGRALRARLRERARNSE